MIDMKWKLYITLAFLLSLATICFYYRYDMYYFFKGEHYLRANESLRLKVTPQVHQADYSSELYLESETEINLELEGSDVWYEGELFNWYLGSDWDEGRTDYRYFIQEQIIKKYDVENDISEEVEKGYKGAMLTKTGLIISLEGKRAYGVTEDREYFITITNVSDKPVAFYASTANR
ncbi:hypothetical protein ACTGZQ_04635 [Streptococcus suis]